MIPAFPKPVPREKKRKPLQEKRWGVSKSKRGTKHGRRAREFGRMAFYSSLWCMLRDMARSGSIEPSKVDDCLACEGPIEVAHLGARAGWRRAPDDTTAPLCRRHHRDIDGRIGGRARWWVDLGRERQTELREKLADFSDNYWRMLTDAQRARWSEIAASRA